MDFSSLIRATVERGREYTIVRPGISLCLLYARPVEALAPTIADILEKYIAFIPVGCLKSYLSRDGTWKELSKSAMNSIFKQLRSIPRGAKAAEFHVSAGPPANVGTYGAHFKGYPLNEEVWPRETNILFLEFPHDLLESIEVSAYLQLVEEIAKMEEVDSGFCGYAFKHLHMTFREESFEAIGRMAMRYLGFDISSDKIRIRGRGRVCNVSWLTLWGRQITQELGGATSIRTALPKAIHLRNLSEGVLIRASDRPMVGDVNRGAEDAAPLRALAKLTRDIRIEPFNLGPREPTFAERWLHRFD